MPFALEVNELEKSFRVARPWRELISKPFAAKRKKALAGFSLSVRVGERLALIGPNGAGKTTLARVATGVVLPDSGEAKIVGASISGRCNWKSKVGLAKPDDPALHPRLTPVECLRFHASLYGREINKSQILGILERLGAHAIAKQRVQTLSSGEKAKVSLAKALLHGPSLLILDEISRVLDPGAASQIRSLLGEFCQGGGAVLLITHDLSEAALCDRVAIAKAGRAVATGAWAEIEPHAREVFKI